MKFDAISDIEFNPKKSFNCQARTLALCISLYTNESVQDFIKDPIQFSQEFNLYNHKEIDNNKDIPNHSFNF